MTVTDNGWINHDSVNSDLDYKEKCSINSKSVKKYLRKRCNPSRLLTTFPVVKWLPKYRLSYLVDDLVAGLTVALTAIPQCMAYAVIADLEPQYGLYSAFMGCFIYFIFGSVKDINVGPTAILSNIVHAYASQNSDFAILATFLSGITVFLLGVLNLGFIVDFISMPVNVGFVTSAALVVMSGQVKSLMGYGGNANDFVEAVKGFVKNVSKTILWDTVLGVATIILLVLLKNITKLKWGGPKMHTVYKYLSLGRNTIAVISGTLLGYALLTVHNLQPFSLIGDVSTKFPTIKPPPFSTTFEDQTLSFGDMLSRFGVGAFSVPLIAILEILIAAKVFSKGKTVDASQELIALGLCNICGSVVQSMPITGSFSRTAINNASGVKTTLGGIFTGAIVLLALKFLSSSFYYIPKTTLAAVIITAMFYIIEFDTIIEIWKTKRVDIIPFILTLIAGVGLGLQYSIMVGAACSIVFLLIQTARPKIDYAVDRITERLKCLIITPDQSLVYSAVGFFRNDILKKMAVFDDCEIIVINGEFIQTIDVTVAKALQVISAEVQNLNKKIYFWKWKNQPISTAYRLNKDFGKLFSKSGTSLSDLVHSKIEIHSHI